MYGNYLVSGEKSGSNFFNNFIFQYAKFKVLERQINPDLTIDEYRLFNNMLSSMPMTFNLFCPLRKMLEDNNPDVTDIFCKVFPDFNWLKKIEYLDVEYIPRPIENYTNDKSAFDVIILGEDEKNRKGIISVEVKYTDLLGKNSSKNRNEKDKLAVEENLFDPALFSAGYSQLARNFLLTVAYKKVHKLKYMEHVVISPQKDIHSINQINAFKKILNKYQQNIFKIDLENIIERTIRCESKEFKRIMEKFYKRYLDFSLIESVEIKL